MQEWFLKFYKRHGMRPRIQWGYFSMLWKSPDSWRRFAVNARAFFLFSLTNRRWQHE
jgi:hypothetical protein